MEFDKHHSYCGPEGWPQFVKHLPGGVDVNIACYNHDKGYADSDHQKVTDLRFLDDIKLAITRKQRKRNPLYWLNMGIAYSAYWLVRVGGIYFDR